MEPVPVGVVGRAVYGGRGSGAGVSGSRPELTAERFVPDPFSGKEGERTVPDGRPW